MPSARYIYFRLQKVQAVHPVIALHSRIFQKHKGFIDLAEIPESAEVSAVSLSISNVLREYHESGDNHSTLSAPHLVAKICGIAEVDPASEIYLVRVLKASWDSYALKQYDLRWLLQGLKEPMSSLRRIEKDKLKVDVFAIPRAIIMCDECEKRSSVVKCEQCMDHFCQECFDELHATGNRRSHLTEEIEQLVCISCDSAVADCQCVQCGSFFCSPCFVFIHGSRSDLNKHRKRNISGLVCLECEHAHATVICEDCVDLLCSACYLKLHKKCQRKKHSHLTVDPNGQVFRGGLIIPSSEAQSVIEKARSHWAYSQWIEFHDGSSKTFWYNFKTHAQVSEQPVDDQ